MGYRRALLFRWSRRDRLAVLVVAVSVAFLVGTTLVVLAAGTQTAGIAAEFGSTGQVTHFESVATARESTGGSALVLPYAVVTTDDGESAVVLARPAPSDFATELGLDGTGVSLGRLDRPVHVSLRGETGSATIEIQPRAQETALPPDWYLAPEDLVSKLGPTGALVVTPGAASTASGSPLQAALEFFLRGTRQALSALSVAAIGAAVLVGVTLFGVTRMGVRDRLETIHIVRATGGEPRTVLALFALRAGLITAVGAALGYALGVILPNAAVSVAVATGQPISLPLRLTGAALTTLVPVLLAPVLIGTLAGALAAYPAATGSPGRIDASHTPTTTAGGSTRSARLRPRLLDGRLIVPTAATLAAFVVFATVAAGLGTALAPIAAADTSTVVEPGSPHPIASQVPESYADALATQGIDASAEILLLEVIDGQPFVGVGAAFDQYAAVHGATVTDGRPPEAPNEAIIGASLASTLDVQVGDRLVLGGSTRERFTMVTVVGRFEAPGATSSQLVVSLDTARHLSGVRSGSVNLVSADRLPAPSTTGESAIGVIDITVPSRVPANGTLEVRVTLRNDGLESGTRSLTLRYGGEVYERSVQVQPVSTRTVTMDVPAGSPGTGTVRVAGLERTVHVVEPDAIAIEGLPARSPPDGRPLVQVVTLAGEPVADASVTVEGTEWRTDDNGRTRIAFNGTGEQRVVASTGDRTASRTIDVRPDAGRAVTVSMTVHPSNPNVLVEPTARIHLGNPWAVRIDRALVLEAETASHRSDVTLAPGATKTLSIPLERHGPGTYGLVLKLDGRTVVESHYTVTGDDRLAAALASSGRTGQTGISRAIEAALGNLRLVIAVVVGLAGLMTVGATTATFAAGVQARRRTLGVHRATGAGPTDVLRLVLTDALKLGLVSTAVGLLTGLAVVFTFTRFGLLTVFGISVPAAPPLPVTASIAAVALGLTLLGAAMATWAVLTATPASLLWETPLSSHGREVSDD